MEHVVICLVDPETADACIEWVMDRAGSRDINVQLVAPLDVSASNQDAAAGLLSAAAVRIREASPQTEVLTTIADGPLLHALLVQGETADLIVVGSHPDPVIRDGKTPSLPVSLAARSACPVVVVPDDWGRRPGPVVVGVDGRSHAPALYAAREAADAGRGLRIVHTWESWRSLATKADHIAHGTVVKEAAQLVRREFPSVPIEVVLEEAVAHDGVIANSRDAHLVVLGTYGLGLETGVVLGAIHQEVMIQGVVPLCAVPVRVDTP